MKLDENVLEQVFEGLSASGVRTMLWDSDDALVYAAPGMQDFYESIAFKKSSGRIELTPGMSWLEWTQKEIELGIIEIPNDMTMKSYLKKLKEERVAVKDKRTREIMFKNGMTILSTDVRLASGGLFSNFFDITEQINQRKEKEQLSDALDSTSTSIVIFDKDGKYSYGNDQFLRLQSSRGLPMEEGMTFSRWFKRLIDNNIFAVPPEMSADEYLSYRESLRENVTDKFVVETARTDGTWVLDETTRLADGSLISIISDQTEIKQQREEVERFSKALDNTGTAIFIFDKDGKFEYGNSNFHKLQNARGLPVHEGMTHEQWLSRLIEKGIFTVPEGLTAEQHIENREQMRRDIDHQYITETGRSDDTWVLDTTTKLDDGSLITVVSDLTKFKKQEAELKRLRTATDLSSVGAMIWDEDDKLVYVNQFVKDYNKEAHGIEVKEGVTYSKFVGELVTKGALQVPTNMTESEFVENQLDNRSLVVYDTNGKIGTQSFERVLGDKTFLTSMVRLQDGSLFQTFSDITELKNHESELERLNSATNYSSVGTMIWDKNETLIYSSRSAQEFMERGFATR